MTKLSTREADFRLARVGPAVLGATSFACADVLVKVALIAGADTLTISVVRAVPASRTNYRKSIISLTQSPR